MSFRHTRWNALNFVMLIILSAASLILAQSNTWVKVSGSQIGSWSYPSLAYAPNTDEFILSMGSQPTPSGYSVQVFTHGLGQWINALPHDSLYGSASVLNSADSANRKWADSTGIAYGYGINKGIAGFGWPFSWKKVLGYLRPNTSADGKMTRAYSQFCYNSDDGKFYYYINSMTFTYNPATRVWDTLSVPSHPSSNGIPNFLKWGSLCYDAYNHEVFLFGGGGVDLPNGSPGTWTFNPTSKTWTELNLTVQPKPRAHSPMVYDPINRCIVLFGGDHLDCLLNDTWVYDCVLKTWSKKNPAVRPKPRAGHAMLYLPKSGKIVLLGGYRYENLINWQSQNNEFEIWVYDIPSNAWGLVKRFGSTVAWPSSSPGVPYCGRVAVDKGDTIIALTDSTRRMACDPTVIDIPGTSTYGVTKDTVALRGGWTNPSWFIDGVVESDTAANEAKLKNLALGTWTVIAPPKTPAGDRTWGTAVLDPDRDLFMRWSGGHAAYCGTDVPQYSIHNNKWNLSYLPEYPLEYDGNNECNPGTVTFNNRPFLSGHTRRCYTYDVNLHKMIAVVNWHTYLYNPDSMDWVKGDHIHNAESYSADRNGGLISTPYGPYGYFNAKSHLFSPDSLRWRKLPQTGTLPGFSIDASGMAYDSKRDRIIHTYQSYGNSATPAKLYEYDFKTGVGKQLFPLDSAQTTGGSVFRECVYLPNLDIVLYLFYKTNNMLAYDCANNQWILIPVSGVVSSITSGIGAGMMYDAKRNLVWITDNRSGNYALRLDSATTRVELDRKASEVSSLTASPNPFNPVTTLILPAIKRELNQPVLLRVFASDGRCIADLSGQIGKGNKMSWSAGALPSGIYAIKYIVGKRTWQTKAVLVR